MSQEQKLLQLLQGKNLVQTDEGYILSIHNKTTTSRRISQVIRKGGAKQILLKGGRICFEKYDKKIKNASVISAENALDILTGEAVPA